MASTGEAAQVRHVTGVGAAAVIAVSLLLVATRRDGLGLSYDSVVYASTARELAETGRWSFSVLWPVGLPALLAIVGVGVGAVALAAVTLVTYLAASALLALRATGSHWVTVGVTAWLSVSLATISTYSMLWSEGLFNTAVACVLLGLVRSQQRGRADLRSAVMVVGGLIAAGLLRFAVLGLLPPAFIALALADRSRRGGLNAVAIVGIGSAGLTFSMVRNLIVGAAPTGPRHASGFSPWEVVTHLPRVLASLVTNVRTSDPTALGVVALVLVVFASIAAVRRYPTCVPLVVVVTGYVGFLLASAAVTTIDRPDYRLMSPVLAPLTCLVVAGMRAGMSRRSRWPALASIAYLSLTALSTTYWATHVGPPGGQLTQRPGLVAAVAALPDDAVIATNKPLDVVQLTGRDLVVGFPDAGPSAEPYYLPVIDLAAVEADYIIALDFVGSPLPEWQKVAGGSTFRIYSTARQVQ